MKSVMLENYMLENTKVKIYNDCIVNDIEAQKKFINNTVLNLLKKLLEKSK